MGPLYVVVRNDLKPGLAMAQACHVTRKFSHDWPDDHVGESLIVLEAPPDELWPLALRAGSISCSCFREPDLGGALTAVALGSGARRLVSSLPLAGRGRAA
jgi:hypothetical protein